MKIVRFVGCSEIMYGIVDGDTIEVLEGTPLKTIRRTGETLAFEAVDLLPPVDPPNIFAIGVNYRDHALEGGKTPPPRPLIFMKPTTAIVGPGDSIILPQMAPEEVDFEAELALVIGKTARHVSEDVALDHVLGCTCANDVSARDCQKKLDGQWTRGKGFDTFCPLGPWIETDLDPENAGIRLRLNGQTMQEANTDQMVFGCRRLVSYLSDAFTLLPGTVIMTGTPAGVGGARTPPVFLRAGDAIEVEIDGLGVLRNTVVREV